MVKETQPPPFTKLACMHGRPNDTCPWCTKETSAMDEWDEEPTVVIRKPLKKENRK